MKKFTVSLIAALMLFFCVSTVHAQNQFRTKYNFQVKFNFSLQELDTEAIQYAVVDFNPMEDFIQGFIENLIFICITR